MSDPAPAGRTDAAGEGGAARRGFRRPHWTAPAIALLAVLLWLPRLSGPIDLRWDAGVYYVLGTSLAEGKGYRIVSEPGEPHAVQYPPLLPVLVAAHERILGSTDPAVVAPALRRTYFVLFLFLAFGMLSLARVFLPPLAALFAASLCLLQLMTYFLSDVLFTELPFACVGVGFALVACRANATPRPWWKDALLYALGAAGFLLRTAGLALLAAWVFEAMMRRRWRAMLVRGVLAVVPVAGWQAYVSGVRHGGEYQHPAYAYQRAPYQYYNVTYAENVLLVDPFKPELGRAGAPQLAARLATNVAAMPRALGETVSEAHDWWSWALLTAQRQVFGQRVLPGRTPMLAVLASALAVLAGVALLAFRREWLVTGIALATIALVCATPWPAQFVRYLSGIGPFLVIAFVLALTQGHAWLLARLRGRWRMAARMVVPAVAAVTLFVQAFTAAKAFGTRADDGLSSGPGHDPRPAHFFFFDQTGRDWERAADWIETHAKPDAIVASTAPHLLWLRTQRRAVLPPMEADATLARQLLEAVPVSYVIVDELAFLDVSRRYARPALESAPDRWRVAFTVNNTQVYERVAPAP